jgi:ribonucleotide monophosphatase NagD (HAD superfamily)
MQHRMGVNQVRNNLRTQCAGILESSAQNWLKSAIGDSTEYDIEPARALGMSTFLVGGKLGLAEAARAA